MAETAVVVVDMINNYEHDDAEPLCASVREALPAMTLLVERARAGDAELIYVNDNHGDWSAGRHALIDWARQGAAPELVDPIAPDGDVPFLVKARHSAFYATQLDYLLHQLGVRRVVVVGQVTEQCVLYTALDAYIRHFDVTVPHDAVAHIHPDLAEAALTMMERNMSADIVDARQAAEGL
jgi:nicotinamidase-related amidase